MEGAIAFTNWIMGASSQLVSFSFVLLALVIGYNVVNPPATVAFVPSAETKELSIIVPAYDEVPNIRPLTERIFKATRAAKLEVELLILDDESKGTAETIKIVDELKNEGYNIKIHARKKSEGKGLSSAVLLGFEKATYSTMLCMDADLQHEPESVPAVAAPVMNGTSHLLPMHNNHILTCCLSTLPQAMPTSPSVPGTSAVVESVSNGPWFVG
jgi:cellulose synthase/poly-beta-1,6-N-acetylglucosamine synthase-like glycosyltransferase